MSENRADDLGVGHVGNEAQPATAVRAIDAAFEGIDTVVHLAAKISDDAGWNALLALNVVGTRNVFEAARSNGVRRVVFASSGATVSGWERSEPYKAIVEGRYEDVPRLWDLVDEDMAPRPGNLYASTKVWGEAIARHYAQSYGIEVSCLRIGYVNDRDAPSDPRQYAVWLSQRRRAGPPAGNRTLARGRLRHVLSDVT